MGQFTLTHFNYLVFCPLLYKDHFHLEKYLFSNQRCFFSFQNGARRRTSGGVYLFLLKTDPSLGIDHEAVRLFLADSKKKEDRRILEARKRKKKKDFNKEMKDFLILRQNIAERKVQEMEEDGGEEKTEMEEKEEEIEELVEIGNNPFAKIIGSLSSKNAQKDRLDIILTIYRFIHMTQPRSNNIRWNSKLPSLLKILLAFLA